MALPRFPTRTLYLKSLGFAEDPFLPIPDSRFLYLSSQHAPLLERLFNLAERGSGLGVVDGEKGVGKSITARRLQSYYQCQPEAYRVAFLSSPGLESEYATLAAICEQFYLNRRKGIESQWAELAAYTRAENREGRSAIVLIDEPDGLTKEAVQQLQAVAASLAPVMLFGQPDLAVTLSKAPEVARSAFRATLGNLSLEDTVNMLQYRCTLCGRVVPIFTPEAVMYIWEATFGNPGDAISICGRAINAMQAHQQAQADVSLVTPVAEAYLDSKFEAT